MNAWLCYLQGPGGGQPAAPGKEPTSQWWFAELSVQHLATQAIIVEQFRFVRQRNEGEGKKERRGTSSRKDCQKVPTSSPLVEQGGKF